MPSNFSHISKIGGTASGNGNSQFSSPRGITTDGRFLWIADNGNHRIKKLKLVGLSFIEHWGDIDVSTGNPASGTGDTGFNSPNDVLYYDGHVFVTDGGNNRIKIHRAHDGKFIKSFGSVNAPQGMANDRRFLWVCDRGNNRIIRYDLKDLSVVSTGGSNGTGDSQLDGPQQIAYDSHERQLYIADSLNSRVLKWDAFGFAYRDKITGLSTPRGVAINGHILYVMQANTVTAYATATLASQASAGSSGTGNANISAGNFIKTHGSVILFTDTGNHRLVVWHAYDVRRGFTPHSTRTIGGEFFINPTIPIGGTQQGAEPTIGGTAQSDQHRWIEEVDSAEAIAWVKE